MRRIVLVPLVGALVAAAVFASPLSAAAAAATGPTAPTVARGTLEVRVVSPSGAPLPLGGAGILVTCPTGPATPGTTDATGAARLAGVPAGERCYVAVTPKPAPGYDQRSFGSATDVVVTQNATTPVSITLRIGATISGRLIGPFPTPPAGWHVDLYGERTGTSVSTTTDAAGRYFANGLPTDLYDITASRSVDDVPTLWKQDVVAQVETAPASHAQLPPTYVHSTYDLWVVLDGSDPDFPPVFRWTGATVTLTNTATGATFREVADSSSAKRKALQFVVPTGAYVVEITTATARYWYSGERLPLATTRASAAPVAVTYGSSIAVFAAAP